MEYESDILKRLIKTYGVVGNPRYISEIIKEFIVQGKERFPELFTYQADWLAHIDVFGLNPSYTVSYTGQSFYAPNTLEKPVKSAILKGCTLVNIVNNDNWVQGTGADSNLFTQNISIKKGQTYTVIGKMESSDIIDDSGKVPAFRIRTGTNNSGASLLFIQQSDVVFKQTFTNNNNNDTIHLRFFNQKTNYKKLMIIEGDYTNVDIPYFEGMQSVKMPVLTTTGKNVFDMAHSGLREESAYDKSLNGYGLWSFSVQLEPNKDVTISRKNSEGYNLGLDLRIHNENTYNGGQWLIANHAVSGNKSSATITTNSDGYIWFIFSNNFDKINQILDICEYIQIEYGTVATAYEPYKSNILTVNEDVTLRSNGDICDELNLLTGQLTQRIDENGGVLSQEIVKTVDLTILDQYGQNVKQIMSFNGGTHFNTKSLEGSLIPSVSVTVETDLEETLKVCSLEGNTM